MSRVFWLVKYGFCINLLSFGFVVYRFWSQDSGIVISGWKKVNP